MSGVDTIAAVQEAFARGDVPAVLANFAEDIHWHEAEGNPYMPSGEAWVGGDAVANNLFARLGEDRDGFSVHPHTFHDAGDVVVVEARYGGTVKATGRAIDAQVCHVWSLEDGKITKFQQYVDTAQLRHVMGVGG